MLGRKEVLHFYSDYPFESSLGFWYELYTQFSRSPESIEARWRIAKYIAGQGRFEEAKKLLEEAQGMVEERLGQLQQAKPATENLFSLFTPPTDSVISTFDLTELQLRLHRLSVMISPENRTDEPDSQERLARFVMLNPYTSDYVRHLEQLLQKMGNKDPLRDNALLEQAKLIPDERLRAEKFAKVYEQFKDTDAGAEALYNLALLKIGFWRQQSDADAEQKRKLLAAARQTLENFLQIYPDDFLVTEVREKLQKLPGG
jgi:tetratricopeptide (TPR) repeat protein